MTPIHHIANGNEFLLVETIPDRTYQMIEGKLMHYRDKASDIVTATSVNIPEGNWEIVGMAGEMSEEQKVVVEYVYDRRGWDEYKDYEGRGLHFRRSISSFLSLLRSRSLKPETTLILKKVV